MGCTEAKDTTKKETKEKSEDNEPLVTYKAEEIGTQEELAAFEKQPKNQRPDEREDDEGIEKMAGEYASVDKKKGLIVPPSNPPPINLNAPNIKYQLHHVYGYRGYDCRQNVYFSDEGAIVYHIAAVGIILNPKDNTQKFFGGLPMVKGGGNQHIDDIICLGISSDGKLCVSGEIGNKPSLYIWKTTNGEFVKKFTPEGKNLRGIKCCAFSQDGDYIAFVDKSDEFKVYALNVKTGRLEWSQPTSKQEVYGISWTKASGGKTFATCGDKHITFWDVAKKDSHKKGTGHGAQTFLCVAFDDKGSCYGGGANGTLYIFDQNGKKSDEIPKLHSGAIHAIVWKSGKLITGGMDNKIIEVTDIAGKKFSKIAETQSIPRALDFKINCLVVGDKSGQITLFSYNNGATKEEKKYIGHHDGELWGLEVTDNEVITTCEDNKIIVWDYKEMKDKGIGIINSKKGEKLKGNAGTSSSLPDNQCSRAVCFNKDNNDIAFATNSGDIFIRNLKDIKADTKAFHASDRFIECMSYSPDGKKLAVGTHSNTVCVYTVPEYTELGKFKHPSSIIGLDWSNDSKIIRSLDEGIALMYWNVEEKKQLDNGPTMTKDTEWNSQAIKLGWHVEGVFQPGIEFANIKAIARSNDNSLLATGDVWGMINFYNHPSGKGAKCYSMR